MVYKNLDSGVAICGKHVLLGDEHDGRTKVRQNLCSLEKVEATQTTRGESGSPARAKYSHNTFFLKSCSTYLQALGYGLGAKYRSPTHSRNLPRPQYIGVQNYLIPKGSICKYTWYVPGP